MVAKYPSKHSQTTDMETLVNVQISLFPWLLLFLKYNTITDKQIRFNRKASSSTLYILVKHTFKVNIPIKIRLVMSIFATNSLSLKLMKKARKMAHRTSNMSPVQYLCLGW